MKHIGFTCDLFSPPMEKQLPEVSSNIPKKAHKAQKKLHRNPLRFFFFFMAWFKTTQHQLDESIGLITTACASLGHGM